jgi:hypothetical protein
MAWHRPAHQYVILFGEDLEDAQGLGLDTVTTHPAGHTHAFEDTGCIGRVTDGTGRTLTVMLTVGLLSHTGKSMALYNTLKTLAFGSAYHVDLLTFSKDLAGENFSGGLLKGEITEFLYDTFGGSG